MDLSALNSTLPPGLADAERDMGDKFRAAALSITNLYKSSLSYTKQAYHVGYSACLADVLSTVQSSIGSGRDASQTLSQLMDWAEAREAAMAAFAADDADDPLPPPGKTRAAQARQALTVLPLVPTLPPTETDDSPAGPSEHRKSIPVVHAFTPLSDLSMDQQTPPSHPSSSPTRSFIVAPGVNRGKHRSPVRYTHHHTHRAEPVPSTSNIPPSSTFQPTLLAEAKRVFANPETGGPGLGSKRPLVEVEMVEEPVTPARGLGRAAKRRTMGRGDGEVEGEKERERPGRKGGKRHGGNGAGAGTVG